MNHQLSWSVERDERDSFVLWWWPRGDVYCPRKHEQLRSENFTDAVQEAKYFLNLE